MTESDYPAEPKMTYCPRCGQKMEIGFLLDANWGKGYAEPARWAEGRPQTSIWTGFLTPVQMEVCGRRQEPGPPAGGHVSLHGVRVPGVVRGQAGGVRAWAAGAPGFRSYPRAARSRSGSWPGTAHVRSRLCLVGGWLRSAVCC